MGAVETSGRAQRRVTVAVLLGLFTTTFPSTVLTIAVQPIAEDLGSLPSTIVWVTTAPMLAAAVSTPLLGRLGDLFGHRRMFLLGIVVAMVFAVGSALAPNASLLIATRTVSQIGGAATVPSAVALLFQLSPPGQRVRATARVSAVTSTAAVIGIVVGGPLIDLIGWRPIFATQAVVCLAALLMSGAALPADPSGRLRTAIDVPGAVVLAVTTFALTFGVNRLAVWGPSPVPLVCLVLVPVGVWALVVVERRAPAPLLPVRVLASRNVRVITGASLLLGAAYMGNFVIAPLYLQSVLGLTAAVTSLLTVTRTFSILLATPTAGRLGVRHGERFVILLGCTGMALAFAAMAVGAGSASLVLIAVALPVSGYAWGHANPALISAVGSAVDDRDVGLAAALQPTCFQIGAVIGIGLFTALAGDATAPGPFALVFGLTAVCALLGTLALVRMRDVRAVAVRIPDTAEGAAHPSQADVGR